MARPTEDDVDDATGALTALIPRVHDDRARKHLMVLRRAAEPRPVWPVKEAADYLGVRQENLRRLKHPDLPEPAYEFPRPSKTDPNRTMRLFWVDEIVAYKVVLDATPRRRNARERAVEDGE